MIFGQLSTHEAAGAMLAHRVRAGGTVLQKGNILGQREIELLKAEGVASVWAARLEPGDLEENRAAERVARAVEGDCVVRAQAATGRVNFYAAADGVFVVDADQVNAVNLIDPAITLSTLRPHERVYRNQLVATVKIIPYGVPGAVVAAAVEAALQAEVFSVKPFLGLSVGLIQCTNAALKGSVLEKTHMAIDARVAAGHGVLTGETRVPYTVPALAAALREMAEANDLTVIFGASAIADRADIVPSAIVAAGGRLTHVGMPVDPGNLLVLGELAGKPVIGAPGCARSIKDNGLDLVLTRLMAGIDVGARDIALMGVGGLRADVPRPHPRRSGPSPENAPSVAIAVLAAGRSSRMGDCNKMLARLGDVPLVRLAAEKALEAGQGHALLVTGHMAEAVAAAVGDLPVQKVFNPAFATGLSSSLKCAVGALPPSCDGILIHLADMPEITAQHLRALCDVFEAAGGNCIVRATANGRRGNPIILPRALFDEVFSLTGDIGARAIIETSGLAVHDVEIGASAAIDVDTIEALGSLGGTFAPEAG